LAIPVDIQAAPSPLMLKHFCASHANVGLQQPKAFPEYIQSAAQLLVGKPEDPPPRNVIAVGLHAAQVENISQVILDLAEALNAPVLTRLDAKGAVDEMHPLNFGVIGVHGKPGLEEAAGLISTSDCIISIGVPDETLLLCNLAGLQIRKLVEIQPDAIAVGTRFHAEWTLLGDLKSVVKDLTDAVEVLSVRVNKKRSIMIAREKKPNHVRGSSAFDEYAYGVYGNPKAQRRRSLKTQKSVTQLLPELKELGVEELDKRTTELWEHMRSGEVSIKYRFV
jgi:thiamine pyrophosphate-dependent acetolactate synthase large subunit-like protein